jgi:DNA-binding transcriptional MerR regulator
MGGYRISELAERTGFPASTLRFYEQEGLLPAAARTPGGYRSYDEHAVERLKFIARAKQLDLPLDEIRDLAAVWDAGSCAPVQERLTTLLTAKVAEAEGRIAELAALRAQLLAARDGLGLQTPDGPCDEGCGCLTQPAAVATRRPVQLVTSRLAARLPVEVASDGEPIACTLGGADQHTRLEEWSRLLERVTRRDRFEDGIRLELPADPELIGQAARLAALEQQCCRFFDFTLDLSADTAVLTVRTPADAQDILDALFGGHR